MSRTRVEQARLDTELLEASRTGNIEGVIASIDAGANVNATDNKGSTPLHYAAHNGRTEAVLALIGKGADLNTPNEYGDTPLHYAATNGNTEIALALIEKGAYLDVPNMNNGDTPLHYAVANGHTEIAHALIIAGADVNAPNEYGITPLHSAAFNGHTEIAHALIDKGANVNAPNEYGSTPLHSAAHNGHTEIAHALIDKGADVNAPNMDGSTPLRFAELSLCYIETIALLLTAAREQQIEGGGDLTVEEKSDQIKSFLHGVATNNIPECQDALEDKMHADLRDQVKALHATARAAGDDDQVLTELAAFTQARQPINGVEAIRAYKFTGGRTALHVLADHIISETENSDNAVQIAEQLVNQGGLSTIAIDARDGSGKTAFQKAVIVDNRSLIEHLIVLRADPNATFKYKGKEVSSLEYLIQNNKVELFKVLVDILDATNHITDAVRESEDQLVKFAYDNGLYSSLKIFIQQITLIHEEGLEVSDAISLGYQAAGALAVGAASTDYPEGYPAGHPELAGVVDET